LYVNPPIWGNYKIGPNKPFKTLPCFFKLPNKGLSPHKPSLPLPSTPKGFVCELRVEGKRREGREKGGKIFPLFGS